jgi:hypothetical protein
MIEAAKMSAKTLGALINGLDVNRDELTSYRLIS